MGCGREGGGEKGGKQKKCKICKRRPGRRRSKKRRKKCCQSELLLSHTLNPFSPLRPLSLPIPRFSSPFRGKGAARKAAGIQKAFPPGSARRRTRQRQKEALALLLVFLIVDRAGRKKSQVVQPFSESKRRNKLDVTMDDRFKFMCALLVGHTVRAKVSRGRWREEENDFGSSLPPALCSLMLLSLFSRLPSLPDPNSRPRTAPSTRACSRA